MAGEVDLGLDVAGTAVARAEGGQQLTVGQPQCRGGLAAGPPGATVLAYLFGPDRPGRRIRCQRDDGQHNPTAKMIHGLDISGGCNYSVTL